MASQNSTQSSSAPETQTDTRLPIRTSEDWEKPSIEELDLCLEVTAYLYHWQ